MSRCMRCGAGAEWLQGNPPKDNSALEAAEQRILALEAALRDARGEIIYGCGHDEHPIIARIDAILHDSQEEKPNA